MLFQARPQIILIFFGRTLARFRPKTLSNQLADPLTHSIQRVTESEKQNRDTILAGRITNSIALPSRPPSPLTLTLCSLIFFK